MNNIDGIIKSALAAEYKSPQHINNRVLWYADGKGRAKMKKNMKFKQVFAALAIIMCLAVPTYAAIKLLTPAQVAKELGNDAIAAAFETEDAVLIDETREFDDYNVTLLGLVSGKTLSEKMRESEMAEAESVPADKTYCVIAIENADGSPITDITDTPQFCVSPFVKGYSPVFVNIMSLNGGYLDKVINGVRYRLLSCENIEIFADTTVYIGVTKGMFPDRAAFTFDETTGEITRADGYRDMNALFELPFDSSKADGEKAAEIIARIFPE